MRRRGFTLTELLISIMILAVLSVVLVGVIPASVLGLKAAGQRVFAAQWARQQVEQMRVDGLELLSNHPLTPAFHNGTEFQGKVEIDTAKDSGGAQLDPARAREVRVTVWWKASGGGGLRTYTCRTTLVKQP